MSRLTNRNIIDIVKEITVAYVSGGDHTPCKETGQKVSDYMQDIYDKVK